MNLKSDKLYKLWSPILENSSPRNPFLPWINKFVASKKLHPYSKEYILACTKTNISQMKMDGCIVDRIPCHPGDGGSFKNTDFKYYEFTPAERAKFQKVDFWYCMSLNHLYIIWNH